MMNLDDVELLVAAVRAGSMAEAARRLGITPMMASRRLAALEGETGARLVHRTTRALSVTAEGEAFLPHAEAMLEQQAAAMAELQQSAKGLKGQLRITASAAFGRKVVAPMMADFLDRHPGLHVDLLLSDDLVDLVSQGIDVAIRIAKLRDNRLVARRLAESPRRLCASPSYIDRHGAPRRLADLANHECLAAGGATHWTFTQDGRQRRQKIGGRFAANSIEAIHQACVGGLGIANLSHWYVEPALSDGTLQTVTLRDAKPEQLAIWAVYPTARQLPLKVRLFVDMLEDRLRA